MVCKGLFTALTLSNCSGEPDPADLLHPGHCGPAAGRGDGARARARGGGRDCRAQGGEARGGRGASSPPVGAQGGRRVGLQNRGLRVQTTVRS